MNSSISYMIGGILAAVLFGLLYLAAYGIFFLMLGAIIYFFLALAGVVPPADVVPIVPYV